MNLPTVEQALAQKLNGIAIDELHELQRGYKSNQKRKERQCEYQRKYTAKKNEEWAQLETSVQQLQEQNQKLLVYYQLFELLRLQNPEIANRLVAKLNTENASASQMNSSTHISTPRPLGSQYNPVLSPSWPMVSLNK